MELQDEQDKRNVFLMGVTDVKQNQKSSTKIPLNSQRNQQVIGLDHNCMSHSQTQNNEEIVKAFKMACLTYKPSPI